MRIASTAFLMLALLALSVGQTIAAEDQWLDGYLEAVSGYFDISLENVQAALDNNIAAEELPVLFFVANQSDADPAELSGLRNEGQAWQQIASGQGLMAGDFYVHYTDRIEGAAFQTTYAKFEGLTRDEFDKVQLNDTDIVNLVNLKFLYKHYKYSQRLIMNWVADGKTFPEIHQRVYAVTTEMRSTHLAQDQ